MVFCNLVLRSSRAWASIEWSVAHSTSHPLYAWHSIHGTSWPFHKQASDSPLDYRLLARHFTSPRRHATMQVGCPATCLWLSFLPGRYPRLDYQSDAAITMFMLSAADLRKNTDWQDDYIGGGQKPCGSYARRTSGLFRLAASLLYSFFATCARGTCTALRTVRCGPCGKVLRHAHHMFCRCCCPGRVV